MGQAVSLYDIPMPTWHEVSNTRTTSRGAARLCETLLHCKPYMTLYTNLMERRAVDDGSRPIFGSRKIDPATGEVGAYEWVTYAQFLDQVAVMLAAMVHELELTRQEPVGIFAKNRYEWVLVEHGANRIAYTLVPLYDTLGPSAIPFIVNQTKMRVLFVGNDQLETLVSCLDKCPSVKTMVQFEDVSDLERQVLGVKGVELKSLFEILSVGEKKPVDADPPLPSDLATICYTSAKHIASLVPTDVHLSYLPLAHVLERSVQIPHIPAGSSIGFSQGDVSKLIDDLATLRPTTFSAVPRVLNRIHDRIVQNVEGAGGFKKALFNYAVESKRRHLAEGYLTHAFWDRLVFRKIQKLVGGRVRIMMNASAPLTPDSREFLQLVFGCSIIEGYGLTETSAVTSMSSPAFRTGPHVGGPVPGVEMCLYNVPEMEYTSNDSPCPRGEVCVRGPGVFKGYYKDPVRTAEAIDADGWFHTGDIGQWNADGTLSIIDRKKNIFKLSQGKYIAPEKIENIYIKSSLVAQVLVHGSSLQDYVVGVVSPDKAVVLQWAKQQSGLGIRATGENGDVAALLTSAALKEAILADLERVAAKHGASVSSACARSISTPNCGRWRTVC